MIEEVWIDESAVFWIGRAEGHGAQGLRIHGRNDEGDVVVCYWDFGVLENMLGGVVSIGFNCNARFAQLIFTERYS